jgi:hypothetical protein
MTVMQQMVAAEQYAQLWTALMPESEVPAQIGFYPGLVSTPKTS